VSAVSVFDPTNCLLGEGPLWHPERRELFWFDIHGKKLLWHRAGATEIRDFPEHVSACGWIDYESLLIASETALLRYDIDTQETERLVALEADNPVTRSNDGRADPLGGFWIGTMGKKAEHGAGAIYRFYRGELRKLYSNISISNAICFSPDGGLAYFADTTEAKIMKQRLGRDGWPSGNPELFVDLSAEGLRPDGAVVDAAGHLWNAQFGAGRVGEYSPDGKFLRAVELPARKATCPAFIDADLSRMICTSAAVDTAAVGAARGEYPDGQTFLIEGVGPGQSEHQVLL